MGIFQGHVGVSNRHRSVLKRRIGVFKRHRGVFKRHRGVFKRHRGVFKRHRGASERHRGVLKRHMGVSKRHRVYLTEMWVYSKDTGLYLTETQVYLKDTGGISRNLHAHSFLRPCCLYHTHVAAIVKGRCVCAVPTSSCLVSDTDSRLISCFPPGGSYVSPPAGASNNPVIRWVRCQPGLRDDLEMPSFGAIIPPPLENITLCFTLTTGNEENRTTRVITLLCLAVYHKITWHRS